MQAPHSWGRREHERRPATPAGCRTAVAWHPRALCATARPVGVVRLLIMHCCDHGPARARAVLARIISSRAGHSRALRTHNAHSQTLASAHGTLACRAPGLNRLLAGINGQATGHTAEGHTSMLPTCTGGYALPHELCATQSEPRVRGRRGSSGSETAHLSLLRWCNMPGRNAWIAAILDPGG